MTKKGYSIVMASCFECKAEGGPFVRIDYSITDTPSLGDAVYCIACGQNRRDALNMLVFSGGDTSEIKRETK